MDIQRGYKYELKLNNKERTLLSACAGTSRFAWNWGLAERQKLYKEEEGKTRFTDAMKQHKLLNELKQTDYGWMYQYSKCIPQEALRDLDKAYKVFWQNIKDRRKGKTKRYVGFPKFKKKGKCQDSFRLTGVIKVFSVDKRAQLPRLGKLRLKERPQLSPSAKIQSATVSRRADRWYVSLTVKETIPDPSTPKDDVIAFDRGLKVFAALSNGLIIPKPKFLLKQERKHRRLSKAHSRKQNGSKNKKKSAQRLARLYKRTTDQRTDYLEKLSTWFTKSHGVTIGEDLHLAGLTRNKKLSKYWNDLAHGEFTRMLSYKSDWYGSQYVQVDRWFPSSKYCSNCLYYNASLTLADRVFVCPLCGLEIDRDTNASINLENYYHIMVYLFTSSVAASSSETLNACGETVRPAVRGHVSAKQEAMFHPPSADSG